MKKTSYYGLLKPEGTDAVDIQNFNDNFDTIDNALHDAADASGDLSNGVVYANVAATRTQIESGNTLGVIIGKVIKWFSDLKDSAFCNVANSDDITASGYVADARIVKTHGDEIDKLSTQNGGLYFGQTSAGKWGYKTSANGTVNPFRNPTGTATAGDVLVGKTFANSSSDEVAGTMPNRGSLTMGFVPANDTMTKTLDAGYYTGGTITVDGSNAYQLGKEDAGITAVTYKNGESSYTATEDGYYLFVGLRFNTPDGAGLDFVGASPIFNRNTVLKYDDKDVGCRVIVCKLSAGQSVHFSGGAPYNWFVNARFEIG